MHQLTILMPAYNASLYIKEAIDSLLQQTFSDFELWIIDDASTDSTSQVIHSFSDPRIKFFKNEVNLGRDNTINKFIEQVNSPFFTITDADDVSHPMRLYKQMQCFESDATLMMCGTSYQVMDSKGYCLFTTTLPAEQNEILSTMERHAAFLGATTVMRSAVIDTIKPFYRSFGAEADADLCCRIVSRFKTTNVKEALYFYRVLPNSMSRVVPTPIFLNAYKLSYTLFQERKLIGTDCLERGEVEKLEALKKRITSSYNTVKLLHQLSFTHAYWYLTLQSLTAAWRAIQLQPLYAKSYAVFIFLLVKSVFQTIKRVVFSKHYSSVISS